MNALFQSPLISTGYPDSTLTFYLSNTTSLAPIFNADGGALANPLTSDAFGNFPPIFRDTTKNYRLVLKKADGTTVPGWDIDPANDETLIDAIAAINAAAAAAEESLAATAAQAAAYANAALAAGNVFDTTAHALSNGVINTASLVGGTGGTDGTFAVAFSGGGGSGAAATFVVAGGIVTQITITSKGIGYTSAPTISFAASSGLTGASATSVIGPRTSPGDFFFIIGSGNTFAELWKNVAGTATDQNLALASAAAIPLLRSDVSTLAATGAYTNLLHGLSVVITNRTDGTTGTATLTETADGLQISNAAFNKAQTFTTNIALAAPNTRLITTIKIGGTIGSPKVGLAFVNGSNYASVTWQNNGWLTASSNYSGGPSGIISQALPTYASGTTLTMQFDVDASGNVYVTCSVGTGKRVCVGFSGLPFNTVELALFDDTTTATAAFKIAELAVNAIADGLSQSCLVKTSDTMMDQFLAPYEVPIPFSLIGTRLPPDIKIYRLPTERRYITNYETKPPLNPNDPTAFVQYVDLATGDDSNAGTAAFPIKSLKTAAINAGPGSRSIIYVKGGLYDFANCFRSAPVHAAVFQVQSWDGLPWESSMHDAGLVWTLVTGATWSAPYTETILNAFDAHILTNTGEADGVGDYTRIALAASLAACESTPGTYFVSGTTVYVHTADGRHPDANVRIYKKQADGLADSNFVLPDLSGTFYFEGGGFSGGRFCLYSSISDNSRDQIVVLKNSWVKYSVESGTFLNGNALVVSDRTVGAFCGVDNFHYNAQYPFGVGPVDAIELNDISRWAGNGGDQVNNNSSNHSGGTLRIGTLAGWGDYHHAEHRGIHDITDSSNPSADSRTFDIGITSRDSRNGFANIACGEPGTGSPKTWTHGCNSSGATFDEDAATGATIYNFDFTGSATNTGAGTITPYTP